MEKKELNKILSDKLNNLAKKDIEALNKREKLNKMEKERLKRIAKYNN